MFLASQLTAISSRFSAHVDEIREFLTKEKLPVPSPEAIPQLSSRLGSDQRFRADVASLMRATLYREREEIGYEDLLGILIAAAAGTKQDLKSESQEAEIREMLRFLLQSRRTMFRPEPEPEETKVAVQPERREAVHASRVQVNTEPVLRARAAQSTATSMKLELRPEEPAVAVAEPEGRASSDVVLPPFRTTGLFAAQQELEASLWRGHSAWIAGVVCMVLGVGLGLTFHRVVSAAEHIGMRSAVSSSSKPKSAGPVAPQASANGRADVVAQSDGPAGSLPVVREAGAGQVGVGKTAAAGTNETASVAHDGGTGVPPAPEQGGGSTGPRPTGTEESSGVPVTVVMQVVTAWPSAPLDSGEPTDGAPSSAETRSIVHQGSAGMTAASVIFSPAPTYPAAASAAGVHGEVTVHAVVDPDGNVIYARAVSGPPLLRDAAQEAVQRWRYSPLMDNGKPIAVATTAILDFKVAK